MKPLVVDGPRMSDIAESGESRLLAQSLDTEMARGRTVLGVHLWTHSPTRFARNPVLLPLLHTLRERGIPVALQVTVTGLGGTPVEPGVEPTTEALDCLESILERTLLAPERICLRIDPLQAWRGQGRLITNEDRVDVILQRAYAIGIRRVRVSMIALSRYQAKILPRARKRGLQSAAVDRHEIGRCLRSWIQKGLDVRSCACDLATDGVPPGACFDFAWVTGHPPAGPRKPVAARNQCLCFVPEAVLLWKVPRRSACAGACLACYAQEHPE